MGEKEECTQEGKQYGCGIAEIAEFFSRERRLIEDGTLEKDGKSMDNVKKTDNFKMNSRNGELQLYEEGANE